MDELAPGLGRETQPPIGARDPIAHFETAFGGGRNAAAADKARGAAGPGENQETRLGRVERLAQERLRLVLAIGPWRGR